MSFINPLMLLGLLSLAVPIVILFLYRKKIVIRWAAYSWMKLAKQKKHKQTVKDDILKLIAKLLLLLFLVLMVARPATMSRARGSKLLIVDTTLSMGALIEGQVRLDRARENIESTLQDTDVEVALYAFDGELTPLVKRGSKVTRAVLESLKVSPSAAGFSDLIDALEDLPELADFDTVCFFSDFQKKQYEDAAAIRQAAARLGDCKLLMCPVDSRTGLRNVGLKSFEPMPEGFYPGRNNRVTVTVRNYSTMRVESVPVTLKVDGQPRDRATVDLLPESEATVELNLSVDGTRESRITVELEPDVFPADNLLSILLAPPPRLNVLAIVKDRGEDPFDYDVFFRNALKAFAPQGYINYKRTLPQRVYEEDLSNYDIVITFGVAFASPGTLVTSIKEYVQKGGSLIAFSDLRTAQCWRELGAVDAAQPGESAVPDPERLAGGYLGFMEADDMDPALMSFFRYRTLSMPDDETAEGRIYLAGQPDPVVLRVSKGMGNMVLAGFMPAAGFGNIFYNPNFVQLTMRTVNDALSREVFRSRMGDEMKAIPPRSGDKDSRYQLITADGDRQQMAVGETGAGIPVLSADPLPVNAFCSIQCDGEPVWDFGFNATRDDSDIEPMDAGGFAELRNDQIRVAEADDVVFEKPVTEYVALMAALLLLALLFDNYAHFWRKG